MGTSLDVAAYLLAAKTEGSDGERRMRAKSLQKLVYYAQAWSMVWNGKPLFTEPIEAWRDGPVVRRLYSAHWRQYSVADIPGGSPEALDEDETAVLDSVLDFYGHLSCDELVELTHAEMPWQQARGDLPYGAHSSVEITPKSIRSFYTRRAVLGEAAPSKPVTMTSEVTAEEVRDETKLQTEIWSETLDWLATR